MDWDEELGVQTVNAMWLTFRSNLNSVVEKCTPKKKTTGRKGKGWMDQDTLSSVRKKHRLFRRWLLTRDGADYQHYIHARNQARKKCRNAQKKQEETVARDSKKNPKAFWSFIKAKTNSRSGIADLKMPDGTKTASDLEKAELLNTFFQSVFTKEDEGPLPIPPFIDCKQEFEDFVIEEVEVRKVLANLQVDKAPGPDGISPLILSQASHVLARPICIIFKRSLQSGEVPDEWRQAVVTPIYKKGCRSDASNYRPVSLTSIVCKCMERLVRDQIIAHLQANNLICKEQHGFVPRCSCCTQLLETLDEWTEIMDDGGSIDAIYTDFQKAFDTVPHRRLLLKLQAHGVRGRVLQWITSFLKEAPESGC